MNLGSPVFGEKTAQELTLESLGELPWAHYKGILASEQVSALGKEE